MQEEDVMRDTGGRRAREPSQESEVSVKDWGGQERLQRYLGVG